MSNRINTHQPQLSVNSISSLVEPITPPPLNNNNSKKNYLISSHQKTQSLDLSSNSYNILSNINESKNLSIVEQPISTNDIINTPLEDLNYLKLATDQFGCRFLQKKLESNNTMESNLVRDLMFDQIKTSFLNLILDPFGNYLIQKLCEFLTSDQKLVLIKSIYQHVFKISINQYGTRSLQKIIDSVDNEQQIDLIINGFSPEFTSIEQVVTLINDLNGNHVIQKCIFKFPSTKFDFIINAIIEKNNIITISTHKHGCCVLQKLLNVCTLQQIYTISLKIIQFLPGLINDQFGNYIIQFLLDIKELDYYLLNELFNKLSNELIQLSCLKFSSNVIEKFIKKLFNIINSSIKGLFLPNINDDVVNQTMNILLTIIDCFTINLNILIRDNYGNYALQTLLDVKNYNIMLNYPDNLMIIENNKFVSFSIDFTNKISNLILLTKDLLPSIKTTSYAKKIKLKVRAYIELTGITSNDLKNNLTRGSSISSGTSSNNGSNNNLNPLLTPENNINNNNTTTSNNKSRQHQRHFSLPANAYHRRNSSVASNSTTSSSFINDKRLNPISNVPSTQSLHNTMLNIFNSQNSSPLNYQQQQFPIVNANNGNNGNNNLAIPFQSLSINDANNYNNNNNGQRFTTPQLQQSSIFFLNDNTTINNNNSTSISNSNSSANLYQQNNIKSNNINNDILNTPNTNMLYPKFAFTSPNPLMNSNDLSFLTPQPQRVMSNPYPHQSFNNNNNLNSDKKLNPLNDTSLMFLGDDEFKTFNVNTR